VTSSHAIWLVESTVYGWLWRSGELVWLLLPPLTTVILGGVFIQRLFLRRANAASYVDAIIGSANELQAAAVEYWNIPGGNKNCPQLAQKIKALISQVGSDLDGFCVKYGSGFGKACHCKKAKITFELLMTEIIDATSGGDFEVRKRRADRSRYLTIVNSVNALKSELRMTKF
jgi:hypothetical protein